MKKPFYTEEGLLLMLAVLSIFFQPLSILCVIIIIMKIHYNKKWKKQLEETTNNKIKDAQNKLNELDNKILEKQAEDNSLNLKLETIQSKLKDTNMIINKKRIKSNNMKSNLILCKISNHIKI
ncbi:phage protein [Clostridium botulinum CFSAN002367]|nr:phage protein [Clostridium botulinum CFSAN002367]